MTVDINNPLVFDLFAPGRKVYIDVSAVED